MTEPTVRDASASEPARPPSARGIFDGFESYRSPSDTDLAEVMKHGLVAADANVLLDLYRYTEQGRNLLLSVLGKLGGQLWIPHQALVEFWRHRLETVSAPKSSASTAIKELGDLKGRATGVLRNWAGRFALPDDELAKIFDDLNAGFDAATQAVNALVTKHAGPADRDTAADPVVAALAKALEGQVGHSLSQADHDAAVVEGQRRITMKIPPGYMDAGKGDNAVGDYLVWRQILDEAQSRKCDVLLVTGDVKEDWWRKDNRQASGPRQELIDELSREAGTRLYMLTPSQFTALGASVFEIDAAETGLEDIDRVDRSREEDSADELAPSEQGHWNAPAVEALFERLALAGYDDRVAVIRWAADNEGFVSQEVIRELCHYSPEVKLNGMARPISRFTVELQAAKLLPEAVAPLLKAVYDPEHSYVKASGFRLHASAEPLVRAMAEAEGEDTR
ncbi:PIN-like domain-containing protein [[Kitasatospora] papulosa]|uniref:PIN-like domain-containing protein n=1 Tax=[Kitasatospora] papulosa TaxID=1464011 RepID=UPI003624FFED